MKKLLTSTLALTAIMAANAADMTVYNNGQISPGISVYGWYAAGMDFAAVNPTGGDTKVFSFKADNAGAAASMGLLADGSVFQTGPLHSASLDFNWYASTPATYTVRLTCDGVEQNYQWEVTEEMTNNWQSVSLPVATDFPGVAQKWDAFASKGTGYVFSIIMDNGKENSVIYFDNIKYSNVDEAWVSPETPDIIPPTTVPSIAQSKEDVLSVFSAYGNVAFNIGSWGQSTIYSTLSIDGKDVAKLSSFNYLGWELNPALNASDYDYMHVDFYPCEETAFGFTPISPGREKVWNAPEVNVNEWNSYDVKLSEFPIDLTNVFQIKFDQGKNIEAYLANVYFYKVAGSEDPDPIIPGEGSIFSGKLENTVQQTFEGETKSYPYQLDYSIRYNEDQTLTITGIYTFNEGEPFGAVAGSVFINGELFEMTIENTRAVTTRTVTTSKTYAAGSNLNIEFYVPAGAGCVYKDMINYTVGSSNAATEVSLIPLVENEVEYYSLQGVRVQNPEKGLYIRISNGKASKVIF